MAVVQPTCADQFISRDLAHGGDEGARLLRQLSRAAYPLDIRTLYPLLGARLLCQLPVLRAAGSAGRS